MFDILFSLEGRLDRQAFMRAAVVISGLCLMILCVFARDGLLPIATALDWPVATIAPRAHVLASVLGLVVVIALPVPIILKRMRDLRLPSSLGLAAIGLVEWVMDAITPQSETPLAGAFAALAVLCAALVLLSLAPGAEERADTELALMEREDALMASDDWALTSGQPERRNTADPAHTDRLIEQLGAQDALRTSAAPRSYPNFAAGEGFGRRRGDRR